MKEEYGLTPYETREILFYKTDNGEGRVEIITIWMPLLLSGIVSILKKPQCFVFGRTGY